MGLTPADALARFLADHAIDRVCVAYSGGRDSHVLLQLAAAQAADDVALGVRALHVDHGLMADSADWSRHCQQVCDALGVPLKIRQVQVEAGHEGLEAAARRQRYAAFVDSLQPDEHMLLAHHADDQAETFLLQALRGSGPDGLAAMPRRRRLGQGWLSRPLLGCRASELAAVADAEELVWIDDPSNDDLRFDRNFIRHEILPRLAERWSAVPTLSRAADRCGGASRTLLALARQDLADVRHRRSAELKTNELAALPRERAFNTLRLWVREAGYRMPRLQDLEQVWSHLLGVDATGGGVVNVRDYEFRRHAGRLHLLAPTPAAEPFEYPWPAPFADLPIPEAALTLTRESAERQGLALPAQGVLTVRSRAGGEVLKLGDPAYHKSVKDLLREDGVPPWDRGRIPLLFVDDTLVAIWNLAVAVDHRRGDAGRKTIDHTEEA